MLLGMVDMRKATKTPYANRFVVFWLLLISGTNALHAQERADVHPYLTEKFFIDLGIYFPDRHTRLGVDGALSGINEDFEFEQAAGSKDDDEVFSMDFGWRFGKKWSLLAQYFKSTGASGAVLTEDIEWKDVVFAQGSNAVVGQEFSVIRVFFGRELDNSARHDFGVGLGIHQLKFKAFIQGEILVTGGPNVFRAEAVSHSQPLPNLGIWYRYSMSPKWVFRSRFDWLDASIDKYDGRLINLSLGVNYRMAEKFGVGLSYNLIELDAAINNSNWRGRLVQRLDGAFIYVSAYW
jgi:hypothetical protein